MSAWGRKRNGSFQQMKSTNGSFIKQDGKCPLPIQFLEPLLADAADRGAVGAAASGFMLPSDLGALVFATGPGPFRSE